MKGKLNIWNALPVRMLNQSTEYFRQYAARWTDEEGILWEVTVRSVSRDSYGPSAYWEANVSATRNGARLHLEHAGTYCLRHGHEKLYKALECARFTILQGIGQKPTRFSRRGVYQHQWNAPTLGRFYGLNQEQMATFEALALGWTLSTGELVDAVRAIVPELEVSR